MRHLIVLKRSFNHLFLESLQVDVALLDLVSIDDLKVNRGHFVYYLWASELVNGLLRQSLVVISLGCLLLSEECGGRL